MQGGNSTQIILIGHDSYSMVKTMKEEGANVIAVIWQNNNFMLFVEP